MVEFGRRRLGVAPIDRLGVAASIDKSDDGLLPFALTNFVGADAGDTGWLSKVHDVAPFCRCERGNPPANRR